MDGPSPSRASSAEQRARALHATLHEGIDDRQAPDGLVGRLRIDRRRVTLRNQFEPGAGEQCVLLVTAGAASREIRSTPDRAGDLDQQARRGAFGIEIGTANDVNISSASSLARPRIACSFSFAKCSLLQAISSSTSGIAWAKAGDRA